MPPSDRATRGAGAAPARGRARRRKGQLVDAMPSHCCRTADMPEHRDETAMGHASSDDGYNRFPARRPTRNTCGATRHGGVPASRGPTSVCRAPEEREPYKPAVRWSVARMRLVLHGAGATVALDRRSAVWSNRSRSHRSLPEPRHDRASGILPVEYARVGRVPTGAKR